MSRTLRRKYYARKMEGLRVSNPRNWWRSVKMMMGQTIDTSQPLNGLANQLQDGDVQALADNINRFFQGVAADLNPLDDNSTPPPSEVVPDEFIISLVDVERKLSRVNVHKAPGPDGLPNWLLRDFSNQLAGPVCAIYVLSDWLQLTAGMPQGSHLGPLTFVILIDALQPGCLTHRYIDDTTMSEILDKSAVSSMQSFVDELVQQATETGIIVNGRKTKEMLIG